MKNVYKNWSKKGFCNKKHWNEEKNQFIVLLKKEKKYYK